MKFYDFNKKYITSILFILIIIIFSLSILDEQFEFYFINNSSSLAAKYIYILILSLSGFFFFIKDKEFISKYYYIIYIILFPFLINGFVGLVFFIKGIMSILVSYLVYQWINDENTYLLLKKISKIFLTLFLIIYFSTGPSFFNDIINHNKDLAIIIIFLAFFIFYKSENLTSKFEYYILLPSVLFFLYFNSSKTMLGLFAFLIFIRVFQNNKLRYIVLLFSFIFISFYLPNTITSKKYNVFEKVLIQIDEITSLRLSRALNPCRWAEYRYFKSRTYFHMVDGDGYKNCPYDKNYEVTLLPLHFLDYSTEIYSKNSLEKNTLIKNLKDLNDKSKEFNLDNFFSEYYYMNGKFFFIILIIILSKVFYFLYYYSYDKKNLTYLSLILTYFLFHSGLFAPGNLMAIIFNIILYKSFISIKNA